MALVNRILIPTDFSPFARRALDYAVDLAARYDATLVVLHVQPIPVTYVPEAGFIAPPANDEALRVELEKSLAMVAAQAKEMGVTKLETLLGMGEAGNEIAQVATDQHCDLIVMATHGRGGLKRLVLGSVADKVIRHASCPVLMVRAS